MSNPVIFKDLPATFPEKDKYQKPSLLSSLVFHALLIVALLFIPVMFPQHIDPWVTTLLVAPLPPPPPPPPPPVEMVATKPAEPKIVKVTQVDPGAIVSPVVIPKDIAIVVDEPIAQTSGVVGGVPGGMSGGVAGGILGGILAANAKSIEVIPPPPPPPPPPPEALRREPIRVGGMVQEPKVVKLVPPVYPVLAQKARVSGTVVLEATLTADGSVDEIRVVSGHPLLINAAIECVKQWKYEPSYLNGEPVAVILTAKVSFHQKITL